ncbi:TRAP transporter substrate-binding protein (plasmid) [Paroceanicella profunda]|uniref:TRAP transporter substrate-binding protein n=1 Tax=Paroceanicella profunda TaxID=2579971 RepID=A0A5B8G3C4_9RHOB|nr:TRAP transporter substrate-binding protein [Paroceanicella profunda]QDL93869.1 TRAP transporter substrate-binding protein [Paroceanicella profunda]
MKSLISAAILAASLIGGAGTAAFADTELVLSSWLPPRHPLVINAIRPWAKEVEEVTQGRVSVRVLTKPLGAPPAHFDMAAEGVADITYGLHSFTTDDRFERSRIGQFSFLGDSAEAASKAFWQVYTEDLDAAAEHKGVHLLGLFMHGPGLLHRNGPEITTPAELAGLKIRTPGGYIADLLRDLGANTLFMSSPEVYEKLSRGVIDGVAFTYEALTAFNLTDYVKSSMRVPGGIYNTTWFLVMNEGAWEKISPEDQAAIDRISGLAFAGLAGKAWDAADDAAKEKISAAGIDVYQASPEMVSAIKTAATKYEDAWAASVKEDGFDGTAALKRMRELSGVGE